MKHKKYLFQTLALFIAAALLLAACSTNTNNQPMDNNSSVETDVEEPTTAPTEEPTEEPSPEPIIFTDDLGREITLDEPAQKVVSMGPSITEILFAVGAGDQVVGRDEFSNYPAEALELESVGGSWGEWNFEKILELEPDLVIAPELVTAEQIAAMEELGLNVYYIANPVDLEGMYDNLLANQAHDLDPGQCILPGARVSVVVVRGRTGLVAGSQSAAVLNRTQCYRAFMTSRSYYW